MENITINLKKNSLQHLYLPEPYGILNDAYTLNGNCTFSSLNHQSCQKIFSNTHNDKVFTLVADADDFPLSIFDINTNIERLYSLPQEFYDKNKISVIHLLDEATPVIAHNNTIYILKEQFKILDRLSNIYSKKYNYTLGIQNTLSPTVSANTNDLITTIDSSNDYLVSISKQGHIASWHKKDLEIIINNQSRKTIHYEGEFFASGIYKNDNILCLGLNNGNMCVIQLNDLTYEIIQILPTVPLTINWIQPFGNELFFATCNKHETKSGPVCCATKKPSCDDCIKDNEDSIRNQNMIINGRNLISKAKELQKSIDVKNKKTCKHVQEQIKNNNLLRLCNHCAKELVSITISANNLKKPGNITTKIIKNADECIDAIYRLSHNRIIISIDNSPNLILLYNKPETVIKQRSFYRHSYKILITTNNCFAIIDKYNSSYIDKMYRISWAAPFERFIALIAMHTHLLTIYTALNLLLSYLLFLDNYAESFESSIVSIFLINLISVAFCTAPLLTLLASIPCIAYYINPNIVNPQNFHKLLAKFIYFRENCT